MRWLLSDMEVEVEHEIVERPFVSNLEIHTQSMFLLISFVLLLSFIPPPSPHTLINTLPGFTGDLPFTLETGYIGVGDSNESQLFYYFVESQRSPATDPLLLWLTGGPGCSALSAFFYESGPVEFDYSNYNGSLPSLHLNPNTWTKEINMLYVDAPVGTGFSYSTLHNYTLDDDVSTTQTYHFLRKWLIEHPQYLNNQLFIGGESYSGIPVPIIVQKILDGNKARIQPFMNLKGYVLGNPLTDSFIDKNSNVPFAHRLALISDGLYQSAKASCGGDYINVDPNNTQCILDLQIIDELLLGINVLQVLEPNCVAASSRQRRSLKVNPEKYVVSKQQYAYWCRDYNYVLSSVWANHKSVRDALHVRENTTGVWKRCNLNYINGIDYTQTVLSTIDYHRNLSKYDLRALIYSGDHDSSVPHIGTENWIQLLNLTVNEYWRPWFVDGQVAGYTEKFINGGYTLIYATVKGGGHIAPEYKPKECYSMIDRWMAYYPL